ncbi:metallophosphoesterase [Mesorhizobium mediterraneum]|uniref:metallophosphoesterase n=1 Tax=Mesorhizobium mediterraneum TaxID=43617 RepID=UPI001786C294|nr:metallophosphoesterase [Mesorhizobium mediterraneum]
MPRSLPWTLFPIASFVTGDLADSGGLDEYGLVVDILSRLAMPVFVIPGNHDRREAMRDGFAAAYPYLRQAEDFLHYVVEDFPVRLIGLDTVVPEKVGGAICAARAAWFADRLAEGDGRPTLVFMHHPPLRYRCQRDGCDDVPNRQRIRGACRKPS